MKVIISPRAEKQFRKVPKSDQVALARKIRLLDDKAESVSAEKLQGFGDIYRVRIGNYRIIYRCRSNQIYVVLISHRKDIYLLLKQLFR